MEEEERWKQQRAANALSSATFWPDSPRRPLPVDNGPSPAELAAAKQAAWQAWWPVKAAAITRLMQLVDDRPHAERTAEELRLTGLKGIQLDLALQTNAKRLAALEATHAPQAEPSKRTRRGRIRPARHGPRFHVIRGKMRDQSIRQCADVARAHRTDGATIPELAEQYATGESSIKRWIEWHDADVKAGRWPLPS